MPKKNITKVTDLVEPKEKIKIDVMIEKVKNFPPKGVKYSRNKECDWKSAS